MILIHVILISLIFIMLLFFSCYLFQIVYLFYLLYVICMVCVHDSLSMTLSIDFCTNLKFTSAFFIRFSPFLYLTKGEK